MTRLISIMDWDLTSDPSILTQKCWGSKASFTSVLFLQNIPSHNLAFKRAASDVPLAPLEASCAWPTCLLQWENWLYAWEKNGACDILWL